MTKAYIGRSRAPIDAPKIGMLRVEMIDGVLHLFDSDGRMLDYVRSIALNQAHDDLTTVTVTLIVARE